MPGMWEEVYRPAEYDIVPVEKPFGIDRENLMAAGIRSRHVSTGSSIRGARTNDSHLAVPEWDAGEEAA